MSNETTADGDCIEIFQAYQQEQQSSCMSIYRAQPELVMSSYSQVIDLTYLQSQNDAQVYETQDNITQIEDGINHIY